MTATPEELKQTFDNPSRAQASWCQAAAMQWRASGFNNFMGSGMGPEKHFSAYFLVTFQLSLFTLYWSTEAFSFTSSVLHSSFSRVQQSWHQLDSFSSFSADKTTGNKQSSWTLRNLIVALYNSTITGEGIFWEPPASVFKGSTTAWKAFRQNSKLEFLIHHLVTSQQILSLKFEKRIR